MLMNASKRPFRFHGCPPYDEEFLGAQDKNGVSEQTSFTYVLNCRPVGTIAPRQSVRFAMELPIPKDASLGRGVLSWAPAPPYEGEGVESSAVTVVEVAK